MLNKLRKLDALLRADLLRTSAIPAPADFSLGLSLQATALLGGVYGACMGLFAISDGRSGAWLQAVASMVKLPSLFLLTLVVTFPSLYVFGALGGVGLGFVAALRLILLAVVIMLAISASFAPILAFFTLSTSSYSFIVLLNVVLLGVASAIGLRVLHRLLTRSLSERLPELGATQAAHGVFRTWLAIFALVGVQMSWLLRPFIGRPGMEFSWFRPRDGSFFQAVVHHLVRLLGG